MFSADDILEEYAYHVPNVSIEDPWTLATVSELGGLPWGK